MYKPFTRLGPGENISTLKLLATIVEQTWSQPGYSTGAPCRDKGVVADEMIDLVISDGSISLPKSPTCESVDSRDSYSSVYSEDISDVDVLPSSPSSLETSKRRK